MRLTNLLRTKKHIDELVKNITKLRTYIKIVNENAPLFIDELGSPEPTERDAYLEAVQLELSKMLIIHVGSFIDEAVKSVLIYYADHTNGEVHRSHLDNERIRAGNRNYIRYCDIKKLVKKFDEKWAEQLDSDVAPEELDALRSIHTNRNKNAHAPYYSQSTMSEIVSWYKNVVQFVDRLEKICLNEFSGDRLDHVSHLQSSNSQ